MVEHRRVQFVVKVSKHCNLRCRYCYEFEHLADKTRMSRENLELAYRHIASSYSADDPSLQIEFVWHGGEPLLLPPSFYRETLADQRRVFGDRVVSLRNVVQTNLTVLDEERIELLRTGFDGIGVSIDLFGGLRVNAGGEDSVKKVLANMDRLRRANVAFGAITVLTKKNIGHIPKILEFYDRLEVSPVRFLALFDGAFDSQHRGYEVTHEEMLVAYKQVFEELIRRDSAIHVEPIHGFVNQIVRRYTPNARVRHYDKREFESVYIVDVDGALYSYADACEPTFCHGNLFDTPLERIRLSPGHLRAIEAAERRMADACASCSYHGACDGYPVAEGAGRHKLLQKDSVECIVERGMLEYLDGRLRELSLIHPVTGRTTLPEPRAALRHVERLPLETGVKFRFDSTSPDDPGRLELSSGTVAHFESPGDGALRYLDVAIVPKEPWREPSAEERKVLVGIDPAAPWVLGSHVGLVRIPDDVAEPMERVFEDHGTRERLDPSSYRKHTEHPGWESAYASLVKHLLGRYALRKHEPTIVRLATAPPGMKTVTKDTVSNHAEHFYVGMHLDTWEKIPFRHRNGARNRITINFGREDRYFLVVNLTLVRMYEALTRGGPPAKDDYYGTDLGHDFMRAFPGYPVVRLRIRPREAYIAPTDNLIHDGSSVGKKYPDITVHIMGYFGLGSEARAASQGLARTASA